MLITPYNDILGNEVKEKIENIGVKVCKNYNLDLINTADYFEFAMSKLKKFIVSNYKKEYENIIISCTNLPTIHIISELEKKYQNNIISSNYCLFNKIKKEVIER